MTKVRRVTTADGEQFRLILAEADIADLAAGIVPKALIATSRQLLGFDDFVRRAAARPSDPRPRRKVAR